MDEAAFLVFVGLAADDQGGDLIGVGAEEFGEVFAAQFAGAAIDALGDFELAEELHFGGHGQVALRLRGIMRGGLLPGEAALLPGVGAFIQHAVDGEGAVRHEAGEAEFAGLDGEHELRVFDGATAKLAEVKGDVAFAVEVGLGVLAALHAEEWVRAEVVRRFVGGLDVAVLAMAKGGGDGLPAVSGIHDDGGLPAAGLGIGVISGGGVHLLLRPATVHALAFFQLLGGGTGFVVHLHEAFHDLHEVLAILSGAEAEFGAPVDDFGVLRINAESFGLWRHFGHQRATAQLAVHAVQHLHGGGGFEHQLRAAVKAQHGQAFDEIQHAGLQACALHGGQAAASPLALLRTHQRGHRAIARAIQPDEAKGDACCRCGGDGMTPPHGPGGGRGGRCGLGVPGVVKAQLGTLMQGFGKEGASFGIVAQFCLQRGHFGGAEFFIGVALGEFDQAKLVGRFHRSAPSSLSSFSTQVMRLMRMRLRARYTAPTVLRMRSATPSISRSS